MSQNMLTISVDDFDKEIKKMSNKSLVSLLKAVYEFKWDKGKMMPYDAMLDIERKETRLNAELMKRKFLNPEDYAEYFAFLKKINFKKRMY